MKLSVIIVNFNHKFFPRLAVEALERSRTDFPFEIIVVDNNSNEEESLGFLKKAHEEKRITLIRSPYNIGFGQGNNLGAKVARGDYILIHNPDVTVKEDSLQKMTDFMERNPDIGVLGPKLVYSSGKVQESCRRDMRFSYLVINRTFLKKIPFFARRIRRYLMDDFDHGRIQDVDLLTGAAMLIRRKAFDEVNGFDPRFFLFMEDFDLCKTIRKAGYRIVYYPEVEISHHHRRLSQGNILLMFTKKVFWLHVVSAFRYFRKWKKK